jgi:hypothetical protein
MKSYDETPWWCQLLWPWFGPPWYAEIEDPDAWLAAIRRHLARVDELTDEIAGDDTPGEEYLAKAGRLTAARHQAEENPSGTRLPAQLSGLRAPPSSTTQVVSARRRSVVTRLSVLIGEDVL